MLTLVVVTGSIAVLLVIAFVAQVVAGAAVAVLSATSGLTYTINRAFRGGLYRQVSAAPDGSTHPDPTDPKGKPHHAPARPDHARLP
ncbi:hypothetical protein [Streptomyces sp. NRRL F-5527]|uniref:hypothetical protein n=1 Tax=Streptomyces sp. NRRL F-5527 TaxID=1463862 RepID=UPI00099C9C02|nr:hypothetical protein [Streptomyces sp. NRRL F-5527]